jgi:hypothetical protein
VRVIDDIRAESEETTDTPTILGAHATPGEGTLRLDWEVSTALHLLHVRVYRKLPSDAHWVQVDLSPTARTYTFAGLTPAPYEWEIRPILETGGAAVKGTTAPLPVMLPPESVLVTYSTADALAALLYPYAWDGGHEQLGVASAGPPAGFDCTGWADAILDGGNLLGRPDAPNTEGLEDWGEPGEGRWLTLWLIDTPELQHCVLEFKLPFKHRWTVAAHTGTICGWVTSFSTAGYHARHAVGT